MNQAIAERKRRGSGGGAEGERIFNKAGVELTEVNTQALTVVSTNVNRICALAQGAVNTI